MDELDIELMAACDKLRIIVRNQQAAFQPCPEQCRRGLILPAQLMQFHTASSRSTGRCSWAHTALFRSDRKIPRLAGSGCLCTVFAEC